jgi:hypothetical protein
MAKKLFGLSVFLWILIALVVLFFVYGVGRREGFYIVDKTTGKIIQCSSYTDKNSCQNQSTKDHITCHWDDTQSKCRQ